MAVPGTAQSGRRGTDSPGSRPRRTAREIAADPNVEQAARELIERRLEGLDALEG